jgi:hypothetical protein
MALDVGTPLRITFPIDPLYGAFAGTTVDVEVTRHLTERNPKPGFPLEVSWPPGERRYLAFVEYAWIVGEIMRKSYEEHARSFKPAPGMLPGEPKGQAVLSFGDAAPAPKKAYKRGG